MIHSCKNDVESCQFRVSLNENGTEKVLGFNVRPKIRENILVLKQKYSIIVFTAGLEHYATPIIDHIDPNGELFEARFFRDTCTEIVFEGRALYTKDLRVFKNLDINSTLLIDNSIISMAFQLDNGIPILPFYNDKEDTEFDSLTEYLMGLGDNLVEQNSKLMNLRALYQIVNNEEYEVDDELSDSESSFNSELS